MSKDMQKEIKKCPCCGSKAEALMAARRYFEFYAVVCDGCGLRTRDFNNKDEAVEAWNRRI